MKISDISLGFSSKKYSHNLSRDCNTTFPFGVVQPIFSQFLLPDSDIKVHAKQLVRLSPLVAPTFSRISLKTVTRFVPEHDLVSWADAFYSRSPFNGSVMSQLPYTDNPTLLYHLLNMSNVDYYSFDSHGTVSRIGADTEQAKTALSALSTSLKSGGSLAIPTLYPLAISADAVSPILPFATIENADFIFRNGTGNVVICFRFGSKAKRLRSVLLGLGYSLEAQDFTPVRLTPILAFYKAYFDTFAIKRSRNFTSTNCFNLIDEISRRSKVNFSFSGTNANGLTLNAFLTDVADCFYSCPQNFVSIHRDKLQNNIASGGYEFSVPVSSSGSTNTAVSSSGNDAVLKSVSSSSLTNVSLQLLQKLSRFTNKNSILGQKLSEYMRLHYGSTSVNSVFEDTNFVDSSSIPCGISDVFSTSDTVNGDNGEHLGAFAGKGIGQGDLSFKFHSSCHGYIITLAAIVPESGFWQGTSTDLFAVDWQSQPSPEFDAVGMELTPRSAFVSHNNIMDLATPLTTSDLTNKSFGFVPRFSGFKFAKNIVNGDMSRRGSLDSLSPYYLDYILASNQIDVSTKTGLSIYNFRFRPIPSTSDDWRLVGKYPWLGNFNRIFIDETNKLSFGSYLPTTTENNVTYDRYCIDDPFMSQSIFNVTVRNFLKPLSLSYDTFEESTDTSSTDVSAS